MLFLNRMDAGSPKPSQSNVFTRVPVGYSNAYERCHKAGGDAASFESIKGNS